MDTSGAHPFDVFLDEVRRRFWERPRGTPDEYGYYGTAICDVADEIFVELSDAQVLQLVSDLYLRRVELDICVEEDELIAGDRIEEVIESVLIAAAVAVLRRDEETACEDGVRHDKQIPQARFLGSN